MPPNKVRLDVLVHELGLAESRMKAQALILAGSVYVKGQRVDKAGYAVAPDADVRVEADDMRFVSRGGQKISSMFDRFEVDVSDKVVIDIGASTGGFTDCLLKRGAKRVYAIDSGRNQLHHRLRSDERVIVMEETNARYLTREMFSLLPTIGVVDVSFISVRKILPSLLQVMSVPAKLLVLVKPQFELGRECVEKGGVVRDIELQERAVELVSEEALSLGASVAGSEPSPLTGLKKGNQEYFICLEL